MTRALVTFATGPYTALQEVALPGLEEYADRHGYVLHSDPPANTERPASWLKVPLLRAALDEYEEVLWVDADVIIADGSRDIADEAPDDAWQGLVRHRTPDGVVPNCGVWLVRPAMREILDRLWDMTQYLAHPWWEQGALCELLGYQGRPLQLTQPTGLYGRTYWLGLEWNSHEERDPSGSPRFAHATAGPLGWRLTTMHRYADRVPVGERG